MLALGVESRSRGGLFGPRLKSENKAKNAPASDQSWKCMYKSAPTGEVTIDDFEIFAKNRANLLHKIENWRAIGIIGEELSNKIRFEDEREYGGYHELIQSNKDCIAHNVLRLAYSKTEELRRFFVAQECALFEARLKVNPSDYDEIIKSNSIDVEQVSANEKQKYSAELSIMYRQLQMYNKELKIEMFDNARVWKTRFTNCLNLVSKRRVFVVDGYAYLFKTHLLNVISQQFRIVLAGRVNAALRFWPYLKESEGERVVPFLGAVTNYEVKYSEVDIKGGTVKPEMINTLSEQSFPLCMKVLHKSLRDKHHLKHQGRMQFGLFLKAIGLSLDDALRFWKDEFTKNQTSEHFEKNYAYNIRHSYGKEGKRTNYSAYGCTKIITGLAQPTSDDHHGCPFKNFNESSLKMEMRSKEFGDESIREVIELVQRKHYQIACRKYFDLTHPDFQEVSKETSRDEGMPFNHPNTYYQKSRQYHDNNKKETNVTK
ncbi:DNA primase large subunit [Acrasis kona]|uniref:DNA primase large subunit n=1 Tax=Acrasis kona TaxID=1008807 RepID=A0AAW2YR09_9EUKA